MFEEGAIPSSESPISSSRGVRELGFPETVPLRMLGIGAGSLSAGCSKRRPPEAVLGSRAEADQEGEVASGSCIWQSVGNVEVARCT